MNMIARLFTLPFLLMYRLKPRSFRYISEMLSLLPMYFGKNIRYEFYRKTLTGCGDNITFHIGTSLMFSDITIGNNVYIERYSHLAMVDIGDDTIIAPRCLILSGRHPHHFDDKNKPIRSQKGNPNKITIGRDVWIGAGAIVMESVGDGSVIGAGSVVTKPIPPYSIAAGNPARILRKRGEKKHQYRQGDSITAKDKEIISHEQNDTALS